MKRPLEQEDDDSSMKRARGSGPKIELRILLQSKVGFQNNLSKRFNVGSHTT